MDHDINDRYMTLIGRLKHCQSALNWIAILLLVLNFQVLTFSDWFKNTFN
ncbi:MAG: hypothetical protein CFH06_01410 [Alphaproteobacteria bacterium MarineAlpha3_Bin5]|nr:MAG: hypothetical protein CFH06_01410 [Alphaproteobacteria bacterium MarineAlpha3_Bin5]